MAQHDYVIANGTGAAVRSDLNNALAAIVSNNSGATEPTTTYAYQWWADTSAGLLKIRNAANNAWITLRELDGTLTIEDGTVSAPGLAFADDLNTGIYSPSADQFAIATNGTERVEFGTGEVVFNDGGANYDFRIEGDTNANLFFVDASADAVGLGTSSPAAPLHVVGVDANGVYNANTDSFIVTAGGNQCIRFHVDETNKKSAIQSIEVGVNNQPLLLNPSGGSVGIGTTSFTANLELGTVASANQSLRINSSGNNYLELSTVGATGEHKITAGNSASGTAQLIFETASGGTEFERARIDSSGRLLVGTSSDSGGALLQVNGNRIRVATAKTPSSASDTGTAGEICWDADYIYVCTATNTWKRTAISTWP